MRLINALRIAVGNSALVFKNLLYKLVFIALFGGITGLVLKIGLNDLAEKVKLLITDAINLVKNADYEAFLSSVEVHFDSLLEYIKVSGGVFFVTGLIAFVLFFIYRFVSGVGDCATMIVVNGHMSSLSHRKFLSILFENLPKILIYQLIDALIWIIYTFITGLVSFCLFKALCELSVFLAIFITVTLIICAVGVYNTFMSLVTSDIVIGKMKVKDAFKKGFLPPKGYFIKMIGAYVSMSCLYVYLFVSVAVFTFGAGLLLLIPFASLFLVCMRQIDYFTINKMRYFIDYDNIVVPKEMRENDEILLNKIDI